LHENLIADFHEASAVGSGVAFAIFLNILLILAEIIENLGIRAAGVAERSGFDAAAATPPVFFVVVEEDAFAGLNSPFVADFGGADFGDFRLNAGLLEDFLPDFGGFGVFRDAVFLIADETSDVNPFRVEPDFFGQKLKIILNLFLFEVVAERPVAKHFENRGVARVANVFNILETHGRLAIGQTGALGMRLAKEIGEERLHAGAGEERGRVVLEDERGGRNNFVPMFNLKI